MAHHWLLIWIVSGCCLGSTVFFHLFAVGAEGGTVYLIYVTLLSASKFLMTLCVWNTPSMAGSLWNVRRVQCVFNTGHWTGSRPKVKGRDLDWSFCSTARFPSGDARNSSGGRGALRLLTVTGHLLEPLAPVPTFLCAGRHLKIRRKIAPSSHLLVKQAKKSSCRKECSDLATPKKGWSNFDGPGIQPSNTWYCLSTDFESLLVRAQVGAYEDHIGSHGWQRNVRCCIRVSRGTQDSVS